jgi:hypothetical protein
LNSSWPSKKKGPAQNQSNQPNGAKGVKGPPRHEEQEGIHHQQGNSAYAPYPLVGPIMHVLGIILVITHLLIIVVCT